MKLLLKILRTRILEILSNVGDGQNDPENRLIALLPSPRYKGLEDVDWSMY